MSERYDFIIHGGQVAAQGGTVEADIGVAGGKVSVLGDLSATEATERFDACGLHVLPGVIDTQVHFREPGLEHKEDLATGTAGAVLGGVTSIFEMPNTDPSTLTEEDLNYKLARARGRAWCDHAFFIGAAAENAGDLARLERLPGCAGVKVFMGSSTGNLLVDDEVVLRAVLENSSRRIAVHSEDEARLRERRPLVEADGATVHLHPQWRDVETVLLSTRRLLALAGETGRRVHVLHVTTAEEMALLAEHRNRATVEVTPQHLTLVAPDCYDRLGTLAQMNPPIRETRHREALWQAVTGGVVDVVGSDHAPHTLEEKARPYPESPSGMTGVQTLLPLLLDHMNAGRLSLKRLIDLTSAGAARIYDIEGKGGIAPGFDADFTIVDLKAERTISNDWIASKVGWTPFDGMAVRGWPVATVIRGRVVMREDEILGDPCGEPVRFREIP
ncbi:MAG: dihydroorotase [Alphaproteobacteria bacterium]|jgi:dihydroorotase|nr:dihydroorotase [Alphaproteobacteria bacterium]